MTDKRIQIPLQLYELMVSYVYDHYDNLDRKRFQAIHLGIERKKHDRLRHTIYSVAKTHPDHSKKEAARQLYLELSGIPEDFRWTPGDLCPPSSTEKVKSGG